MAQHATADAAANSGFAAPVWSTFQNQHDETSGLPARSEHVGQQTAFAETCLTPEETAQVEDLIRKLDDDDYGVREKATAELRLSGRRGRRSLLSPASRR